MNKCARAVIDDFNEITLAYGQSDEYSFVFRKDSQIYSRRGSKLITNIASLFASSYVFHWTEFFPDKKLKYPPCFDGRAVLYPSEKNIRDYLSWRQADCHINNLYNTVFWTLVQKGGLTPKGAQERLSGTLSGDKNEILYSEFGINYNTEPNQLKKGTTIIKRKEKFDLPDGQSKMKNKVVELDCDIIGDQFWTENPHLLEPYREM
jgi:tRNA(His) guanylyltransferase